MYDNISTAAVRTTSAPQAALINGVHPGWQHLRDAGHLLDTRTMAHFVAKGFVRFDALVGDRLNREFKAAMEDGSVPGGGGYSGEPLEGHFPPDSPIGRLLALPRMQGIIASLVGPEPVYDHHAIHRVGAMTLQGQNWHADATIDPRLHFDIQIMYFPQDTSREMGGTMILPGSHFRHIHEVEAARYQNFRGQLATICPAGTVIAVHHNLWHCAQPNRTTTTRYMFKLRLQPTCRQQRLWHMDDLQDPSIANILTRSEPWMDSDVRLEFVQRLRLWRLLTGDSSADHAHWLGRLENDPQRLITP